MRTLGREKLGMILDLFGPTSPCQKLRDPVWEPGRFHGNTLAFPGIRGNVILVGESRHIGRATTKSLMFARGWLSKIPARRLIYIYIYIWGKYHRLLSMINLELGLSGLIYRTL